MNRELETGNDQSIEDMANPLRKPAPGYSRPGKLSQRMASVALLKELPAGGEQRSAQACRIENRNLRERDAVVENVTDVAQKQVNGEVMVRAKVGETTRIDEREKN